MKCNYCGKEIPKKKHRNKGCEHYFCSKECYVKFQNTNIIHYVEDYVIIETQKGEKIFIDLDDYIKLNGKTICVHKSGYATFWDKHSVRLHRFIMNCPCGVQIDHINRNKLDNRKCNLRFSNFLENANNKGLYKNNVSGCKGVHKNNDGKYVSRFQYNNKRYNLGTFNTLEEAINARKEAERKYFKLKHE